MADGTYRLCSPDGSLALAASGSAVAASESGCAFTLRRDASTGLYSVAEAATGRALTAPRVASGSALALGGPGESAWSVTRNEDGTLRLSPASDPSLSLDVRGGWKAGAGAILHAGHTGQNQRLVAS